MTVGTICGYTYFTVKITNWRDKIRKRMNNEENAAASKAMDSMINFETVRLFNNENHECKRYLFNMHTCLRVPLYGVQIIDMTST